MIHHLMTGPAKRQYTFRDYEQLPEGAPYQLIGGELTLTPSPTFDHQEVLYNLAGKLRHFVAEKQLGKAVGAPIDVYLSDHEVYQPDIIFISNERINIISERVRGVPDMVMEIVSPSTGYYDLVQKKRTCEQSGVREYWIVDPQEKLIEVHWNIGQEFKLVSKARICGLVSSQLLTGFTIDLNSLF